MPRPCYQLHISTPGLASILIDFLLNCLMMYVPALAQLLGKQVTQQRTRSTQTLRTFTALASIISTAIGEEALSPSATGNIA